jgi:hypothetical protein
VKKWLKADEYGLEQRYVDERGKQQGLVLTLSINNLYSAWKNNITHLGHFETLEKAKAAVEYRANTPWWRRMRDRVWGKKGE